MARKYKFHKWYSVMWIDDSLASRIHCFDLLTKKEAKAMAEHLYHNGAYRVDIMKRVHSQDRVKGVVKLDNL